MAAFDEVGELSEELQPLPLEARPSGRRTTALVALGLGLAAAATYALAPGSRTSVVADSLEGVQGKAEELPEKLAVEGDLGNFIDADNLPEEANPDRLGASLGDVAAKIFAHVAKQASLHSELTSEELESYKYRFIAKMLGMEGSNQGVSENFVQRAKRHIDETKPVMTAALAKSINCREKSFQVQMQPWMIEESMESFNSRLIKVPYEVSPQNKWKQHQKSAPEEGLQGGPLPEHFESTKQWPKCKEIIENPHNQGRCGSCWVFGATGSLDSRLCIHTDGAFSGKNAALSRGFSVSCVPQWDGCQGGWPHLVYDYIDQNAGVPSTNCVPYFAGTDYANHWSDSMPAPACPKTCDKRFPQQIGQDMFKPTGLANYKLVDTPDKNGMMQLRRALVEGGPVPYAFYANREFMGYSRGVFASGCGHQANHAVQAIGYGVEDGTPYIQSLNSWGTQWGNDGKFNVADCIVWHFVLPGKITNTNFPLPIPDWD